MMNTWHQREWANRSCVWLVALAAAGAAPAQQVQPPRRSSTPSAGSTPTQPASEDADQQINPLAAKQEMIRDRFQRFQDRVFSLREQLSESEPENAARLAQALQRAGELGLSDKLEEIIKLLDDPSMLHKAVDEEDAFLASAEHLLELLLAQSGDEEERRKEIERLKEYKERVEQLLQEQRDLRKDSGQAAAEQRMKDQLDQAIGRIGELQKQQSAISDATKNATPDDPSGPQAKAEAQSDLSRDTAQLTEDLKRIAEPPTDPAANSPAMQQARNGASEASKSSQSGSQSMSEASESLQKGNADSAGEKQQDASRALEEAKEHLEAARKAMDEKSEDSDAADKQKGLAEKTQELADRMKQGQSGGQQQRGKQDGQQGGGQGGEQGSESDSPGQPNVQQAQQQMEKAAESLEQKSPGGAAPKQDKAIEQLEQAQQELEKALEELRKEERAETLRDLEARIRDMLAKQEPINGETVKMDQLGEANFKRAEQLQLAELSTRQRELSEKAATCLHILDEDATTIAFPRVIEQLMEDMVTSADRLAAMQVGAITQTIQTEIVDTLEQLLDAVHRMQEENENSQGQQSGQSGGAQPLLPPSAELKLLRSSQLRINNRTGVIADSFQKGAEARDSTASALAKLAARQAECADIAREMRDKEQQQ